MKNISRALALEKIEASADDIEVRWSNAANALPPERFSWPDDIDRMARLWAERDVLSDVSDDRAQNVRLSRRYLAGCMLAARAARAGDLADMAWGEPPAFGRGERRRVYHGIRRLCRAYDAALAQWARKLRAFAKAITRPVEPEARRAPPPSGPFEVHPDHLAARLLDIFKVRAAVAVGEKRVEATWTQPVNAAKLRGELEFILAPARVVIATPTSVTLEWD
jgi:hypothetical protein